MTKVNHSVSRIDLQRKCVGALKLSFADIGLTKLLQFSTLGSAIAIEERPCSIGLDSVAMVT